MKSVFVITLLLVAISGQADNQVSGIAMSSDLSLCASVNKELGSYQKLRKAEDSAVASRATEGQIEEWTSLRQVSTLDLLTLGNIEAVRAVINTSGPRVIDVSNLNKNLDGERLTLAAVKVPGAKQSSNSITITGQEKVGMQVRLTMAGLCPYLNSQGAQPTADEVSIAVSTALANLLK
jgi:hypothetical protein